MCDISVGDHDTTFEATKKQILILFVSTLSNFDEPFDSSYYIFDSRLKIQPRRTTLLHQNVSTIFARAITSNII